MQPVKNSIGGNGWQLDVALPAIENDAGYVSDASSQYEVDDSIIAHYSEPPVNCEEVPVNDIPEPELGVSQPESIYEVDESLILGYQGTPPPPTQVSTTNSTDVSSRNSSVSNVFSADNILGKRKMSPVREMEGSATKWAKLDKDSTELEDCYIIAHDPRVERLLDENNIGHGFSYELARLISHGASYDSITDEKIQQLIALKNISSSKIETIFTAREVIPQDEEPTNMFALERAATSPWEEIQLEERALHAGPDGCVGNNPACPGWYGGKPVFRGRLVEGKTLEDPYEVKLEEPTLGPSSRNTRHFGSASFFRIKISDKILHSENNALESFFKKRFILWNKVYRAVYAKDGTVFLFWTNEQYRSKERIPHRMSFEQFFDWLNPLSTNARQFMTKWAARTALNFSNSVPGPCLAQEDVHVIEDLMSSDGASDMTDGCGFTSKNIHVMIANLLDLAKTPAAFQFRLGGFKGMSVLKDDDQNDNIPRAWFRPSQTKISFPEERVQDKSQLTFDILRTCRLKTSTRLSSEVIINLHENGVPAAVFVELMKQSVNALVKALTTWEGPDAMYLLWMNVERAEGVLMERRARVAKSEARARGAKNTSIDDGNDDEDDREENQDPESEPLVEGKSAPWWPDDISGCPSTLGETVMSLLDSGFTPQDCPVLREGLKNVLDKAISRETTRLRFEVVQSCNAFAIPDPCGVLGENEIHVKSSRHEFKLDDGTVTDTLIGDVLVTRNPCKVPSDTRKVKAVDHPALRHYTDVVIFSTKGNRRLIDYLAGGDYDGDTVIVFWNKLMVTHFRNANDRYSHEPPVVETCFTRDTEKGDRFLERLKTLQSEDDRIHAYQYFLLGSLRGLYQVGMYSTWHDNAIYKLGYSHPETHALAAKFCRVLDSAKTGYRIKPQVYREDKKHHDHPLGPKWKTIIKGKKRGADSNRVHLARNADITTPFIMDILLNEGHNLRDIIKRKMDSQFSHDENQEDPHLSKLWNMAREWSERGESQKQKKRNLGIISLHVRKVYHQHKNMFRDGKFLQRPIRVRQDMLRRTSREFASSPKLDELPEIVDEEYLRRLCASYAYVYDREQTTKTDVGMGFSRFPFNVAMGELCAIKAKALGPTKVTVGSFYQRFRLDKG